jgi:pimeloyl-ACP methyl ester carboxylesterase
MNRKNATPFSAPSLALLGLEPLRAAIEYTRLCLMDWSRAPTGDGHPVVIFPGLGTNGTWAAPLKSYCRELGYAANDWGRGMNRGPSGDIEQWLDGLAHDTEQLIGNSEQRCTLIGWSLGGIYAREMAKRLPGRVRQVITIGSPFAGDCEQTNAGWLFRLLNGRRIQLDHRLARELRTAPPVPTTSIYSRSDGVVAWQACREKSGERLENVEVSSSHIGLVWNPTVLHVIADRLAQREGLWRPFAPAERVAPCPAGFGQPELIPVPVRGTVPARISG